VRVLVVEDDEDLQVAVPAALRAAALAVDVAGTIAAADEALWVNSYDCVVFDRKLPDGDAIDYVRTRRRDGWEVPVLFLTAMGGVEDRVRGFEYGGDDYLVKPFAVAELIARVRNLLRPGRSAGQSTVLRYADVELDTSRREVRRAGVLLTLTAKEFAVLEYLMARPEEVVSRTVLIEKCWDEAADPMSNVVDVTIRRLRGKLRGPDLIQAVRGLGYRLTGPGGA
jgi:DNA-binding response OmpR family regulator